MDRLPDSSSSDCPGESRPDTTQDAQSLLGSMTLGDAHQQATSSSTGPRADYISWDDLFMSSAFLIAMRSKDPVTQVGACIVNDENKIVGMGYNGMPNGCHDNVFPWGKTGDPIDMKYMYVCHAEMNAVLNKNSSDVKNCRIYVGLFPCNECAKIIIQSGIKEVIFLSDKNRHQPAAMASRRMFNSAGVTYRQYLPQKTQITIDFSKVNWGNMSQMPPSPKKSLL
ncbi:Deoxycytidylate deaminase [Nesidiocoris tenuis]|uniref:dCMP deaminase n=1 Tax=Nesidiocoris tenuis TaxID=355587 RepID=A0ABN7AK83_9HEMI|nr:Deoxycytidylate deaminase [Nesidiocoris tenuis]